MSELYTLDDLADLVQSEGLGYAIQYGVSSNRIEDDKVSELWDMCERLMNEIETRLPERD